MGKATQGEGSTVPSF